MPNKRATHNGGLAQYEHAFGICIPVGNRRFRAVEFAVVTREFDFHSQPCATRSVHRGRCSKSFYDNTVSTFGKTQEVGMFFALTRRKCVLVMHSR